MFSTVSTAWPRPSGPVRKPEIERPGLNGVVVDLGAVKRLEPIAGGIAKRNQAAHAPRVGQRLRLGRDLDAGRFQPGGERVQRGGVRDLPAEEARAFAHRAVDHDALLAVVHPERQQRIAALDRLQADQAGAELPPVVQRIRPEARISQTQQCHPCLRRLLFAALLLGPNATRIFGLSNPKRWAAGLPGAAGVP